MKKTTRPLLLAVVSAVLLLVSASQNEQAIGEFPVIQIRALLPESSAASSSQVSAAPATTTQPTTSAAPTSSSQAPTPTSSSSVSSQAGVSSSAAAAVSTTDATSGHSTPTPTTESVVTSALATTNSAGEVVTSFIQYTPTPSNPTPSQTQTSSSSNDGGGLSTGSIIGLSVSGGIAAVGIISFFVWKFTRKRFADFDDNEAIKWPELNAHNSDVHALPTHSTGRSGFGPENDSDINLTRAPSPGAYANSIGGASLPEAYGTGDPYAVPPLPHLNPNQPYRDDPGAYGQPAGFYDPYRGPVPNTFAETVSDGHVAESIPMTQMAGARSPGPQAAYDMQGRSSPVPQAAVGYPNMDERSRTPNPTGLDSDRNTPSPHPGYGYGPR